MILAYIVCLIALSIGTITDLKTREVPDYLNYLLIAVGFGTAILASIIYRDVSYILASGIGFTCCFLFSIMMYYTGQWGGGDAKMLMGVGAAIGLPYTSVISLQLPFLIWFMLLTFFIGGIYGTVWMAVVLFQHWKNFKEEYERRKQKRRVRYGMYCTAVILAVASLILNDFFLRVMCIALAMIIVILYYLFIMIKILEEVAFIKEQPMEKVTEGDWVAEDIIVDKKIIVSKKNLGITKEQLAELQALEKKGKIKTVKIKYGIPFVPSFLLAFIATSIVMYM